MSSTPGSPRLPDDLRPTGPDPDRIADDPLSSGRTPDPPGDDGPRASSDDEPSPPSEQPSPAELRPTRVPGRLPLYVAAFVVGVLAGSTLLLTGFLLGRQAGSTPGTAESRQKLFQPFWDVYNKIEHEYVGDVDQQKLVQGAIRGVFEALGDPYSGYMSPEDFRTSLDGVAGRFEGIGTEMTTRGTEGTTGCMPLGAGCRAEVARVYRGSPAVKAGLQTGDIVVAVDGKSLDGMALSDVVKLVRGPRGSAVTLTVERGGGRPFDVRIVRDVIESQVVESEVLAGGTVGYIRIDGFSPGAAGDFRDQLRELVETKGVKRIVLDLRGDPGGFVDAARTIASQFVADGPLYWEEYAGGRRVPQHPEPGGVATSPEIQVVVLVDRGTASASEIVAAALQEGRGAKIVGQTTYGKGTIQQWSDLGENGGFRLSIAKWLTPRQNSIDRIGVVPDVAVEPGANPGSRDDEVLERALQLLSGAASGDRSLRPAA